MDKKTKIYPIPKGNTQKGLVPPAMSIAELAIM
jgi:hypothetical protein